MCEKNEIRTKYGSCNYCISDECSMIYNLYVKLEYRGRGNARNLILQAIECIRKNGYEKEITIKAQPQENSISNEKLILFYEKMGLRVVE